MDTIDVENGSEDIDWKTLELVSSSTFAQPWACAIVQQKSQESADPIAIVTAYKKNRQLERMIFRSFELTGWELQQKFWCTVTNRITEKT